MNYVNHYQKTIGAPLACGQKTTKDGDHSSSSDPIVHLPTRDWRKVTCMRCLDRKIGKPASV